MAVDKDVVKNGQSAHTNVKPYAILKRSVQRFFARLKCAYFASADTGGFRLFANP
jgi:hypothetical protein